MKAPLAALALLSLCTVPALPARAQDHSVLADPLPEMLVKLQGSWTGTEKGAEGKCHLTIKGSAMHFQGSNKNEWYKAIVIVTAGVEPAQLSGKITECPMAEAVGKVAVAIFKLEDGTLTLVGHAPGVAAAPKSFEGDADSRTFLFKKTEGVAPIPTERPSTKG